MSAFDIDFKALKREVGSNMYMVVVLVIFLLNNCLSLAREQLSQMILKKGLVTTEKQQNNVLYNSIRT